MVKVQKTSKNERCNVCKTFRGISKSQMQDMKKVKRKDNREKWKVHDKTKWLLISNRGNIKTIDRIQIRHFISKIYGKM